MTPFSIPSPPVAEWSLGHERHALLARRLEQVAGLAEQALGDAPRVQSENIGTVTARCDLEVSAEDCLRTLKDEVCKAGGDLVWGVDKPTVADGKQKLSGRAAHTKKK